MSPAGVALIETHNLLARGFNSLENGEPLASDIKLNFLEFLLKTDKHQVLIDILLKKEYRDRKRE